MYIKNEKLPKSARQTNFGRNFGILPIYKSIFSTFLLNKFDSIGPENEELAEKKESAEEATLQSQRTLNIFDTPLFRVKKQLFPNCLALIQVDYKALKPNFKNSVEFVWRKRRRWVH